MFWSNVVEGINEIVVEKYWIIVNLSCRFVIVPLLVNEMVDDWFWLVFLLTIFI